MTGISTFTYPGMILFLQNFSLCGKNRQARIRISKVPEIFGCKVFRKTGFFRKNPVFLHLKTFGWVLRRFPEKNIPQI